MQFVADADLLSYSYIYIVKIWQQTTSEPQAEGGCL